MSDHKHEAEQELIEMDEKAAHEASMCRGAPMCGYCLDDWEEVNREELDKMGYYDSKGHWTT